MLIVMQTMKNKVVFCSALLAGVAACGLSARAQNLIQNGGFETGDFTGWTVATESGSSGSWYVSSGYTAPIAFPGWPTAGPASGTYYAVYDQNAPTAAVLLQSFTVPAGVSQVTVSFDMFVNDWHAAGPIGTGLDFYNYPNQHAQVDILSGAAGPWDSPLDELVPPIATPNGPYPYTPYSFNVAVTGGQTYQLRFGAVDDLWWMTVGVDDVSVTPVPDTASTLGCLGAACIGLMVLRRRG
jgi:hypothetical protein